MSAQVQFAVTFGQVTCGECGIVFYVPDHWKAKKLEHQDQFWCPNGHNRQFRGETEAAKLRRELAQEKSARERAEQEAKHQRSRVAMEQNTSRVLRGHLTRVKKRVGNGACPCCKRSFTNLRRHMATKHPEYAEGGNA